MGGDLHITGAAGADELLNDDATALLIGMLLDQQIPMERAFSGPFTLRERLGHLDAARIAAMDVDAFTTVCRQAPAIHRYPAAMGERIHRLATVLVERYDGDAERLWTTAADAAELTRRLRELPGFGDEKTKIFTALLAKRMGVRLDGWERAAGVFADDTPRSVADIHDPTSLARVREWKKAQKAAKLDKQDRPLPQPTRRTRRK